MPSTRRVLSLALCMTVACLAAQSRCAAADDPRVVAEKERELIALLRSDAAPAEKAVACKMLAVYGSEAAVPELARLLPDERLASWARIALEAIPGQAPNAALRKAVESLQGNLLIGVINSLGVRRDADAVETLRGQLEQADADVAASAASALGRIGTPGAAAILLKALSTDVAAIRNAAAEGAVLCAERASAEGREADAVKLYDAVRDAKVPRQRFLEATRGAILARKEAGLPLLIEQLRSPEKAQAQIALSTAREMPGKEVAEVLILEATRAAPDRAVLILQAIADRHDSSVLTEVLRAASTGPKPVRLAALAAVGRLGDATCLTKLLEVAVENDADLARASRDALAALPGEKVNAEIVARLAKAEGKVYPVLLELVGVRRISALDSLMKAVEHRDSAVRSAALNALGPRLTRRAWAC
jgi:HEAT repeat protein